MAEQIGKRLEGKIVRVKGHCGWGHKEGDVFELSAHNTANLCGFFYHDIFPTIIMLQFGGGFPWGDSSMAVVECPDRANAVRMELRRED